MEPSGNSVQQNDKSTNTGNADKPKKLCVSRMLSKSNSPQKIIRFSVTSNVDIVRLYAKRT